MLAAVMEIPATARVYNKTDVFTVSESSKLNLMRGGVGEEGIQVVIRAWI